MNFGLEGKRKIRPNYKWLWASASTHHHRQIGIWPSTSARLRGIWFLTPLYNGLLELSCMQLPILDLQITVWTVRSVAVSSYPNTSPISAWSSLEDRIFGQTALRWVSKEAFRVVRFYDNYFTEYSLCNCKWPLASNTQFLVASAS